MRKLGFVLMALALIGIAVYESRYSSEMQDHINEVNRHMELASIRSIGADGLMGSLQTMRDEADIAGEILETHEYVHTVRDELLARKIKQAAGEGYTVGDAIQNVLAFWPRRN